MTFVFVTFWSPYSWMTLLKSENISNVIDYIDRLLYEFSKKKKPKTNDANSDCLDFYFLNIVTTTFRCCLILS